MAARSDGVTKVVVVGNGGAGKTTLLIRFDRDLWPEAYTPTVYENSSHPLTVDGVPTEVTPWDTGGGEDYERLRPLCYPDTDVFLLCFALNSRRSFEDCPEYWLPELHSFCPHTPVILVGCKSDLVKTKPDSCIPLEEIHRRAKEWGLPYRETSSYLPMGVNDCFVGAVRTARRHDGLRCTWKDVKGGGGRHELYAKRWRSHMARQATVYVPSVDVEGSEFGTQWTTALENPENDDVTFKIHSGREVRAHSLVLSAASPFFKDAIADTCTTDIPPSQCGSSVRYGVLAIWKSPETKRIHFQLEDTISEKTLDCVLRFMYTGICPRPEDGGLWEQIKTLGHEWNIPFLSVVLENMQNDEDALNPSIGTYLNIEMCKQFKSMYFNSPEQADVFFQVEGHRISAHRAILTARCPVLAAMLSGRFVEGTEEMEDIVLKDVHYESFMALLEYIYTDTAPIEEGDAVAIMAVADQFCQSRLVTLCELYITHSTHKLLKADAKRNAAYVIDLLKVAQRYNAKQLETWCLHALALNFADVRKELQKAELSDEQMTYVDELRRPEDNRELFKKKKCTVM